jgi:hypothetical protein
MKRSNESAGADCSEPGTLLPMGTPSCGSEQPLSFEAFARMKTPPERDDLAKIYGFYTAAEMGAGLAKWIANANLR